MKYSLYIAMAFLLTACTDAALWIANQSASNAPIHTDVAYGAEPHQRLDLYGENEDAPLIAFFYGGGWSMGQKSQYQFVADTLVERGYRVAVVDYGLWPQVAYPEFVEDTALALAWLAREKAGPIIAMGHSAGAYNVAMAVAKGAPADGVIALAGPYAFEPSSKKYRQIFAAAKPMSSMKVPAYVTAKMAPVLLMHGTDDSIVSVRNSHALSDALSQADVAHIVTLYPDTGHYGIMLPFVRWRNVDVAVLKDIEAFVQDVVAAPE
jgi:acetyl esterase/lipase